MASANFDALHLKLSRKIFDPVAAAATDGSEVTSALRTDYLNRANKFIQFFLYGFDKDPTRKLTQKLLSGLVSTQSITFAVGGDAVASDFSYALSCYYYTGATSLTIHPLMEVRPDQFVPAFRNAFIKDTFTIYGGSLYGMYNQSALTSGSGILYYIANDQRASSGDTSDIAIDAIWYESLVDLAATYHFEDKGKLDFAAAQEKRTQLVLAIINAAGS